MNKRFLLPLVFILSCLSITADAQQTLLSSFHQYSWQLQNPAAFDRIYIYDRHKNMMFNATYRDQWAWSNVEGSPKNYSLSFENIVADQGCRKCTRIKWGFNVFQDETHAIRNTGFHGNFSYYIPISNRKDQWLHFGLNAGMIIYGIDADKIQFKNPDNNLPGQVDFNQRHADFNFGIFYRHQKKFYLGLSTPQIFSPIIDGSNLQTTLNLEESNGFKRIPHVYMIIGGFLNSSQRTRSANNITVEPSLWLRYVPGITYETLGNLPMSADLSVRAYYNTNKYGSGAPLFWVGTGYGTNQNLKMEVGLTPSIFNMYGDTVGPDRIRLGISWELPLGTGGVNLGQSLELNLVYAWSY